MTSNRRPRERDARRASAMLCVALVLGFAWGLDHWTHGFAAWTFEDLRRARIRDGEILAAPVALLGIKREQVSLWADGTEHGPRAFLVDFVYTRCLTVCRTLGSEFQQMQQALSAQREAGVHLVSISFDVARDGPAQLAAHATALNADPRYWTIAVPTTTNDARRLLTSLGVVVVSDGTGGYVHNGAIHLLDARGRLRGLYEFDQWPHALAAARRLASRSAEDKDLAGSL